MPDLALDDITLHYEIDGSGPPILLLAGMMGDNASWGALLRLLTPHFTVIRPDNRTTGQTTPWDAPVSVGQMAEDAAALMRHLGHERYHVTGHSMGGLMAMELSGLVGDAMASLTILASAPVRIPRTMHVFDTLLAIRRAEGGETHWLNALYPWAFRPAFFENPQNAKMAVEAALAYPHAQTVDAMAHQIEALRNFRPRTRAGDIKTPTQVIFAAEDLMIPEAEGRQAFAAIEGVSQITLPDAGHSIHWDAPEAVAERVIAHAQAHTASG
ncbi:alpha/beta fold hydrolase [Sulfitobacter mediterraneus]|uniref:alpha/beta fold hydrolase n=1 Tax=Sulfitobacter mediterraneus TaxID=83219 RepID=UPI0019329BD1|nr:alpha/beta hydrolase [Sulfitobacter mediterraneus]MBM1632876.1 alpha/beta fold hydrolase [Sulfitobacter mediterraneus]MBM1640990.1 alpha/beta fold hydrolase [Sulfitobacter mediterraneus]MBM1644741.1 alpha/beta fold hydrolase [Sulfitobacter mediterraneus]MBM1649110.1 alpha/beta fold hydrolase [Sulfitobacter mediterraneus]MBM1653131.1 alpha/beta fold hydrolase [Sulfitobacter mediterraneus]